MCPFRPLVSVLNSLNLGVLGLLYLWAVQVENVYFFTESLHDQNDVTLVNDRVQRLSTDLRLRDVVSKISD